MATSTNSNLTKFCLEHMVMSTCSKPKCTFSHYGRKHIKVINVKRDEGCVEGQLSNIPLCRHYMQKGYCHFANKCRYRHEITVSMSRHSVNQIQHQMQDGSGATSSTSIEKQTRIEQSKDKLCGICFENVVEKADDPRFGILPNCTHSYCMSCIYKWRQTRHFEHNIIKACPECRVTSDFVYPSPFWVDNKDEKEKLISDYKKYMSNRDCKHFKKGNGKCPFGNKCFYKHALANGKVMDVGPPRPRRRPIINDYLQHIFLWNIVDGDMDDEELEPWQLAEEFEDLYSFFTDDEGDDDMELDFMESDSEYLIG